jgi:hypothetical protein
MRNRFHLLVSIVTVTVTVSACATAKAPPAAGASASGAPPAVPADAAPASAPASTPPAPHDALFDTIAALDAAVFDAFNHCNDPAQLQKHGEYFAPDVEFYHDAGGVTWNRQDMLDKTARYVCGTFRRELIPGSLRVFPIATFGAISLGVHRFCQFTSGTCDGEADFTMVWRRVGATAIAPCERRRRRVERGATGSPRTRRACRAARGVAAAGGRARR